MIGARLYRFDGHFFNYRIIVDIRVRRRQLDALNCAAQLYGFRILRIVNDIRIQFAYAGVDPRIRAENNGRFACDRNGQIIAEPLPFLHRGNVFYRQPFSRAVAFFYRRSVFGIQYLHLFIDVNHAIVVLIPDNHIAARSRVQVLHLITVFVHQFHDVEHCLGFFARPFAGCEYRIHVFGQNDIAGFVRAPDQTGKRGDQHGRQDGDDCNDDDELDNRKALFIAFHIVSPL